MRLRIQHIFVGVVMLLVGACARVEIVHSPEKDRVPLSEFNLGYQIDRAEVYTKADDEIRYENAVVNLYVMLFKEDGSLVHKRRYMVTGDSYNELEPAQQNRYDDVINTFYNRQDESDYLSNGTIPDFFEGFGETVNGVTAADLSGNLTFYAIANYSSNVSSELDNIKDIDGLQNFVVDIPASGSVERTYFFMTAEENGVHLDAYEENGQVMVNQMLTTLRLRRLDAKITFNISVDIEHVEGTAVTFSNPTYKVHNIPNMSYLLERSKSNSSNSNTWDAAASQSGDFSCMLNDNYETIDNSLSFSFYIRENRPLPKKQITEAARTEENGNGKNYQNLYVMREAWDSENVTNPGYTKTPVHGRNFTYAPLNSTFVEISGNLNYTRKNEDGEDEIVAGNVTYIVHLGETGDAGDASNIVYVNNYDVRRNVRYIYNMSITGINSFEVEVTEEGEKRPGAEGDLSISDSKQFTLDAHYTRFMFELDKESILRMLDGNNTTQNAGWNVSSSPVGGTGYNAETGLIDGSSDYKWVLFAINQEFGYGDDKMVKFPGTQAYDGGVTFFLDNGSRKDDATLRNEIANDFGNNYPDGPKFKNSLGSDNFYHDKEIDDNACLRDINQLLKHLYKNASEDDGSLFNDGKVTITAFCDEYTYIYDPTRDNYIHPGTPLSENSDPERRLKFWKEFSNGRAGYVNAANRVMNITPMVATDISADGNTTITHSFVSISQLSIKTIYDENNASLDNAWGLETVNETGKLAESPTSGRTQAPVGTRENTASDGRTNFINFWINNDSGQGAKNWNDVMTTDTSIDDETGINPNYRDAYHACITRNRDLDGDNVIEENEIFWYLAAKDQLVGLWLGQASLAEDAWLYDGDGTTKNHVVTSSYNGANGPGNYQPTNFWVLWAEEGASWGKVKGDEFEQQTKVYDYRCIRNLGINITASNQSPSHYAVVSGPSYDESGQYYTIDVSRINSRALRSSPYQEGNLPLGHERSQYNQPFSSFDVKVGDVQAYQGSYWNPYEFDWLEMSNWLNSYRNPCPNGWRVPNQREFLIMMSSLTDEYLGNSPFEWNNIPYNNPLGIATSFSFNGLIANDGTEIYSDERYGFEFSAGNLYLHNEGNNFTLDFRCVRDHTGN